MVQRCSRTRWVVYTVVFTPPIVNVLFIHRCLTLYLIFILLRNFTPSSSNVQSKTCDFVLHNRLLSLQRPPKGRKIQKAWKIHDRTENACTVSTSRFPIQSLRKLLRLRLYGLPVVFQQRSSSPETPLRALALK